jgi:hypothetical protein
MTLPCGRKRGRVRGRRRRERERKETNNEHSQLPFRFLISIRTLGHLRVEVVRSDHVRSAGDEGWLIRSRVRLDKWGKREKRRTLHLLERDQLVEDRPTPVQLFAAQAEAFAVPVKRKRKIVNFVLFARRGRRETYRCSPVDTTALNATPRIGKKLSPHSLNLQTTEKGNQPSSKERRWKKRKESSTHSCWFNRKFAANCNVWITANVELLRNLAALNVVKLNVKYRCASMFGVAGRAGSKREPRERIMRVQAR